MKLTQDQQKQFMTEYYDFINDQVRGKISRSDRQFYKDVINSTSEWVLERMLTGAVFTKWHISKQIIDEVNYNKGYIRISKHRSVEGLHVKYIGKIKICPLSYLDSSNLPCGSPLEKGIEGKETIAEIMQLVYKSRYPHVLLELIQGKHYKRISQRNTI